MEPLKKLRIDPERPVHVINAPEGIDRLLPGIEIKEKLGRLKPVSQLMLFAADSGVLGYHLPRLADYIAPDTLFWICYPKKTGAITSDLFLMKTWDVVFNSGYRCQTSISLNDDWTGMRFTNAPKTKPSIADLPIEERIVEGIDFVNRTAVLPGDALSVLAKYKGLTEFFNSLAFTHKKEHVMAIVDAKKPETRVRRIEKMVEMLLKMQADKELRAKGRTKK